MDALKTAGDIRSNRYDFPSVCLWYAEFYDMQNNGAEKNNTTTGAIAEMEFIKNSGFLRYSPVAVRLVPDYYGVMETGGGGNTQQGWWDDEHWRRYQDPREGNGR